MTELAFGQSASVTTRSVNFASPRVAMSRYRCAEHARETPSAPENDRGRPWRGRPVIDASQGRKSRQRANLGLVVGRGGRRRAAQRASQARRQIDARPVACACATSAQVEDVIRLPRSCRREDDPAQIAKAQRLASEWKPK